MFQRFRQTALCLLADRPPAAWTSRYLPTSDLLPLRQAGGEMAQVAGQHAPPDVALSSSPLVCGRRSPVTNQGDRRKMAW